MDLSWWSVAKGPRPKTYSEQTDLLTDQSGSQFTNAYPEKRISFPEARQLVEAKMPNVITGGKTYVAAASTRRESKSVQCQTSLTWVFSDRPLNILNKMGSGDSSVVRAPDS